jgi:predicted MFS family arabinose efflux permease
MTIYLIVLMAFLSQAGFGGSRVAVSLHALELTANQFAIGFVIALYSLAPIFLSIAIGRLADRASPHRLVILGSLFMTAALVAPALISGLALLCAAAFVLGLAHLIYRIPIDALGGGLGGPETRARHYAFITMGWSAANFAGPVIAGFSIDHMGRQAAYLVLAALTLAPVLVLWLTPGVLAGRASGHKHAGPHGGVLELWNMPALHTAIIAAGVAGTAQDLFQFYGHTVGLSASAIGTIMGLMALAAFVIRGILPFLARRFSELQILGSAIFFAAFAFTLFPFFSNAAALGTIAFLLGLGVGCGYPMTMSLLYVIAPPNRLAEALGLNKTLRNTAHLVVPLVFGSIGTAFGFTAVFWSNSALLATGGVLLRRSRIAGTRPGAPR